MALDTLSSLMILVCVVALVILLSLTVYTWYKWHMKEQAATPNQAASAKLAVEMTSYAPHDPQTHFQKGYLNVAGRDSPNLSGSRTFLNDEVLKQKPNPPPHVFESKDVVFHANGEHNPDAMKSSDIVFHSSRPFADNKTTNGIQAGHVVYNVEDTNGKRRWTESTVPEDDEDGKASHRKNTYL